MKTRADFPPNMKVQNSYGRLGRVATLEQSEKMDNIVGWGEEASKTYKMTRVWVEWANDDGTFNGDKADINSQEFTRFLLNTHAQFLKPYNMFQFKR